jgi:hypothetical protein
LENPRIILRQCRSSRANAAYGDDESRLHEHLSLQLTPHRPSNQALQLGRFAVYRDHAGPLPASQRGWRSAVRCRIQRLRVEQKGACEKGAKAQHKKMVSACASGLRSILASGGH